MSVATLVVVGNLGQDPETREVGDKGSKVCNFSIAHNRKFKGEESTDWYNVAAWGGLGEVCQTYLQKGSQVVVSGELQQRPYTDKDGNDRMSIDVRATDVQFVGGKPDGAKSESNDKPAADNDEDDIPF